MSMARNNGIDEVSYLLGFSQSGLVCQKSRMRDSPGKGIRPGDLWTTSLLVGIFFFLVATDSKHSLVQGLFLRRPLALRLWVFALGPVDHLLIPGHSLEL